MTETNEKRDTKKDVKIIIGETLFYTIKDLDLDLELELGRIGCGFDEVLEEWNIKNKLEGENALTMNNVSRKQIRIISNGMPGEHIKEIAEWGRKNLLGFEDEPYLDSFIAAWLAGPLYNIYRYNLKKK